RDGAVKDLLIAVERAKAQIRARVEHSFHVIKNLFGHRIVRSVCFVSVSQQGISAACCTQQAHQYCHKAVFEPFMTGV
ncbi:transposase, partial [Cupriavidus sp. AcVe19-6a]|nr:transposase [Cupriavidus sp. AcVe19-1a]MBP0640163.1 transposase [Cupriavidus sp. AcVe19-6a]